MGSVKIDSLLDVVGCCSLKINQSLLKEKRKKVSHISGILKKHFFWKKSFFTIELLNLNSL